MPRIRINNFGPIKEGLLENEGWIDIRKVTVFIGNQGSGKSTVAKLVSTLLWLEKSFNRKDTDSFGFSKANFWHNLAYHRLFNYERENSLFGFEGSILKFFDDGGKIFWTDLSRNDAYEMPKIMYIPAERNFLSVIDNAFSIKNLPANLAEFAEELRKSQLQSKGKKIDLGFGGLKYTYDEKKERSYIIGKDYDLDLAESSSGFQSLVPLLLVSKFLGEEIQKGPKVLKNQLSAEQNIKRNKEISDISFDTALSPEEKDQKIQEIDRRYLNTCFINIVEEPEQNLFPSSQKELLFSLLGINNSVKANKLIMTTHSPYLINYLTLAVKAGEIWQKNPAPNLARELQKIVPKEAAILSEDLVIYEMDENKGSLKRLETFEGLPSDENYLNNSLNESNDLFARLLRIEQKL
jgi:predicted ATPase